MIEIMRQLIVALTALLALLQGEEKLGAAVPVKERQIISDIKTQENDYFSQYGKYQQIPTYTDGTYEVEAYKYRTPKDEYGYQTILRKTENGKVWERSENFGVEGWRTYDWKIVGEIYDPQATTTP